ncbi:terminase large subunit [Lederbergia wuyishanensis]|uniref:Phage terminase large subunit-like protein n=1 Tax=Lederbergia wuyishanensis TaxID=1347903 RepID=A0ABU0D4H8_9BACI|nr:terminase TerL endonuclease subunit [Lederbergia wuyishanensis]MCJ8008110.1 terminase large subunit [Lederbergia wuyishanensis]MDQ0343304.1 phage terminase large subunit-like protein [Lederbergia wuyishanensis]
MILLEKAIRYAERVTSGKEITTKEVIIQCHLFLRDLKKQDSDDFDYYFDEDAIETIEGILSLLNFATGLGVIGKPVLKGLEDFQAFFLVNIFGWRFKDDPKKYRYRDVTLFIPRKNAKTFICALILIILMLTEDDYSEFYSICLDRELAGEVKKAMSQIINASPAVSKYFVIPITLNGKVICKLTNSFFQARTAEANKNNSIRPSAFIADEVGAFKDYKNINAMRSGQLNVKNPLRFKLTTAYAEDKSIMLEELAYIRKVFNGFVEDDRMFALLYYAEEEHLWDDTGLYQANPLRIEENFNEIRDARKTAIEKPAEREEYLCKHMNHFLPSNSGEAYINVDDLRKCKIDNFDWSGRQVWVGLDLAMTTDNCSYSMVTEEDQEIYAESFAFVPEERIEEKNKLEKINYYDFIQQGVCFACGDMTVDYGFIEEMILAIEEKHNVVVMGIGYDRYNCLSSAQRFEREGYTTVEVRQHSSVLHPPTKLLKEKILNKEFHYTENVLLEENFQNAKVTYDTNKNMYVNKKKSTGKVDMVVSLINAIYLLQQDVIFNPDADWGAQVI